MGESILTRKGASGGVGNYSTWVVQDENSAKYESFNGYDFITNPTPVASNNYVFNDWLLNNSATGQIVLTNTVMSSFTYNGPNTTLNQSNMPFVSNINPGFTPNRLFTNNGKLFIGTAGTGVTANKVYAYFQSNSALIGNTPARSGAVNAVATNNGFIYAGGTTDFTLSKFNENDLTLTATSANTGGSIRAVTTHNGKIFQVEIHAASNRIRSLHENNLVFITQNSSLNSSAFNVAANNGFVYIGVGSGSHNIAKYNENLAFVSASPASFGAQIFNIAINNGFIFVSGGTQFVSKYHESNLAFVGNSAVYGNTINALSIKDGYIYVAGGSLSGTNRGWRKMHESNFTFVTNSTNIGNVETGVIGDFKAFSAQFSSLYNIHLSANIIAETLTAYSINKLK
jgi:hypothetical protein